MALFPSWGKPFGSLRLVDESSFDRARKRLTPPAMPKDDRGRSKLVLNTLVLHVHPARIPEQTLKWIYTWGLGGLAALLLMMLIFTGVFLQANYTPAAPDAYLNILNLRSNV